MPWYHSAREDAAADVPDRDNLPPLAPPKDLPTVRYEIVLHDEDRAHYVTYPWVASLYATIDGVRAGEPISVGDGPSPMDALRDLAEAWERLL